MSLTVPASDADPRLVLQRLAFPDPEITTEDALFAALDGPAHLRLETGEIVFGPGGTAFFDTYMNLFNLRLWHEQAGVDRLWLRLEGTGRVGLRIWQATGTQAAARTLFEDLIDLSADGVEIDLAAALDAARPGVVAFRLVAFDDARLTGGAWLTTTPATTRPPPLKLAISVTTFRRETAVAATAARLCAFLDGAGAAALRALDAEVHLFVVDNGQSAAPAPHPRLTLLPNANLGGSGGFARGLAAAEDGGFTHCLFMDDDASVMTESLLRTLTFLRCATSDKAAVAGAMISDTRHDAIWENGARFDGACRPQHSGVDLGDPDEVIAMELAAADPKAPNFYAGWWFFAFPLAAVTHYPFPFFVRGDDVSFSLVHEFDIATPSGVVSFQEDFFAKETPLVLYLDLRSFLHHHIVQKGMQRGALGTALIALKFIGRSLARMHYESAEAQLMAWEDVLKGPDFFAENADMMARRPDVTALIKDEAWQPAPRGEISDLPDLEPDERGSWLLPRLLKYTINGHLVPGWRFLGRRQTLPSRQRGALWPFWGAREVQIIDPDRGTYIVRHSKRQFLRIAFRAGGLLFRWIRAYPDLAQSHRDGYERLATREYWETRFLPDETAPKPQVAE